MIKEYRVYNYLNAKYVEDLCLRDLERYNKRIIKKSKLDEDFFSAVSLITNEIIAANLNNAPLDRIRINNIKKSVSDYYGVPVETIVVPIFGAPVIAGLTTTSKSLVSDDKPVERIKEIVGNPLNYLPKEIKLRLPLESDDAYSIRLHIILFEIGLYHPGTNSYTDMLKKYDIEDEIVRNTEKFNKLVSNLSLLVPTSTKFRGARFSYLYDNVQYMSEYLNQRDNLLEIKSNFNVHLKNALEKEYYEPLDIFEKYILLFESNKGDIFDATLLIRDEVVSEVEIAVSILVENMMSANIVSLYNVVKSSLERSNVSEIEGTYKKAESLDVKVAQYAIYLSELLDDLLEELFNSNSIEEAKKAIENLSLSLKYEIEINKKIVEVALSSYKTTKIVESNVNPKVKAAQKMRVKTAWDKFDTNSFARREKMNNSYFENTISEVKYE